MKQYSFLNGFFTITDNSIFVLQFIFGLLVFFSTLFFILKRVKPVSNIDELIERTNSWWKMIIIINLVLFAPKWVTISALALLSFVALREFFSRINLDHTNRKIMFWSFLVIPIQYYAAYINYYRFFIVFIPVVMFTFLPIIRLLAGHTDNTLRSVPVVHWTLMLTVFSFSHIAYILNLDLPDTPIDQNKPLILYLLFLTQFNDVLQFIWGKLLGKHKIVPKVSPNKTWEGFLGGLFSTIILAYFLKFLTPFNTYQTLIAGGVIALLGFLGDLNISAIKRDLKIKDMGSSLKGHGGFMDRLDSLSFTGMLFFHLVHLWMVP